MSLLPIVILAEDASRWSEALALAKQLFLPLVEQYQDNVIHMVLTSNHIELKWPGKGMKPLFVDFENKQQQVRIKQNRGRRELIAKAVGVKGAYLPSVIDATAGLGGDALMLASLGCEIVLLERSPIIYALLADGLRRIRVNHTHWLPNLSLKSGDARDYLQQCLSENQFPDVIYLDPMFPPRTKNALVKKEMRMLKEVVGDDEDATTLFALARRGAKKRVVVKRPRLAPTLVADAPDITYSGKVCRFDVYLNNFRNTQQEVESLPKL